MTSNDQEELFSRIEAEQQAINQLIEDSKRLSARSDLLMSAARTRSGKSKEGDHEDA